MATVRINMSKPEEELADKPYREMSFMEKVKSRRQKSSESTKAFKQFCRILFTFQSTTQLYVFLVYILPGLFEDGWTRYWMKVLAVFLCLEWLINYFCTVLYSTDFQKTRDSPTVHMKERWENPPEYFESYASESTLSNGHATEVMNIQHDNGELPFTFCDKCKIYIPPRTHHCDICKTCILKRDHHCYFAGTCIGFRNQRYFYVWAFYSIWVGSLGFYFTVQYLKEFYSPYSWMDFIPVVAFYRWVSGTENISFHIVLLILHLYLELMCAIFGMIYFSGQTMFVARNMTMFEFVKKIKVKSKNSFNQNYRSVFGDFWALNFLFPMTILFKQRENGITWDGLKIDYNSNHK